MKFYSLILVSVVAVTASTTFASTHKICFGSTKAEETKGVILSAELDRQTVSLKTLKGADDFSGTFPTFGTQVKGRDGKVYLEYKGPNFDYQEVIMVDETLFEAQTVGLLQFRARGEGFFNSVFVCKDDQRN